MRDWFAIHHESVLVELFVPRGMLESFNRAFYESEAWETPTSVLTPTKMNMYPGLQMPTTLLESAPGFIGKREEIKALALPYEERIKKLEEIDEANFQKRLLEYSENNDDDGNNTVMIGDGDENSKVKKQYLGSISSMGSDDENEDQKTKSYFVSETEIESGSDEVKIRLVGVKPTSSRSHIKGSGVENIFK